MTSRPNYLIILSDQHNPHNLGSYGDSIVRTPNLDRLAQTGVRFDDTYCAAPLCVPSRMTFLTSRHCSDIEVWTNDCYLASDVPTFADSLGAAGYETVLGGRMHFIGPDQRHGFEHRIIGDVLAPRPGGPRPDLGDIPIGATGQTRVAVEVAGPGRTAYQAYDVAVTEACQQWLETSDRQEDGRPFCLVTGYILPHCPFVCPPELFEEYYARIELPQTPPGYFDALHPAIRLWREKRGITDLSPEQVRRARASYYGLITFLDDLIGRMLKTLASTSFADDTVVVYVSDHGDMAAENGMWWKSSFYEGAAGVPMIWSWPGHFREGVTVDRVTNLIDVGPTLIDLAGGEALPRAAGNSLRPMLETGDDANWTDETFSEIYNGVDEPVARMIRSGRWKLNYYEGYDDPQLFDLQTDPSEFTDLARDPNFSQVRDDLLAQVRQSWDGEAIRGHLQTRNADRDLLRQWASKVEHDLSDFWKSPPGANAWPLE